MCSSLNANRPQISARDTSELQAVYEIARILSSAPDLLTLLEGVAERLVEGIDAAESVAVFVFSEATETLDVSAARGFAGDAIHRIHLKPGESMTGIAFESEGARLFPTPEDVAAAMGQVSAENRALFDSAFGPSGLPHSGVCAPLISQGRKLGVLTLHNLKSGRSFLRSDLGFIQALAGLLALAIDRERLQKEAEQGRVLQEANRLKSELLSTLSHEMRTPLASIKGYATALLLDSTGWNDATRREFLGIIDEEADNLQELIADLLESSTIEAGLLRIEKQPVLLRNLAERVVAQARLRTQKHRFLVSFSSRFPIVDADPRRIEQVLHNLVDNAIKYSPAGGLIVLRGEAHQGEVTVSVADEGVGIAPEHLNRLFERFFRIKSGLGPKVMGAGLGLPIARTIVEGHGGRIWAESTMGSGTTMFFTLPAIAEEDGGDERS